MAQPVISGDLVLNAGVIQKLHFHFRYRPYSILSNPQYCGKNLKILSKPIYECSDFRVNPITELLGILDKHSTTQAQL